tara:strand:+ start:2464 stop:3090 length:627 start_codon:yes stop_codon:yes gene_type:complete
MKLEAPFFVPIFNEDCPFFDEIKEDITKVILDLHNKDPYAIQGNFPKGKKIKSNLTEGDHNFLKNESESIVKLREWILQKLLEAYSMLKIKGEKVVITESWFHVTKKNGYHNFHTHPETPLGGIFYIEDGGSDTGNQWLNPIHGYSHRISDIWCKNTFENKFIPGRLVLFPGWILHSAKPHNGNKNRILFAFNSTPVLHNEQVIRLSD